MKILDTVISAFFPNTCAGCGEIIDEGDYLCEYCFELSPRRNPDRVCPKCGHIKKYCDCSKHAFHFDGCAAPFVNDGVAKKMMYDFKFYSEAGLSRFFAEQMALTVKQCYFDKELDCIIYVPLSPWRELKRGYNQSALLAKDLSKILGLPLGLNYLKCRGKHKVQHKISGRERFKNVKGIYSCEVSLTGRNILLVDDIKTTGATFDECAKQLIAAGAESVYCIAGLISEMDDKNKKKNNQNHAKRGTGKEK